MWNPAAMRKHVTKAKPGARYLDSGGRDSTAWQRDAACAGAEDPDLFFPVSTVGPGARQLEEARRVCRRCPVRVQCADWARRTGPAAGVWGGKDVQDLAGRARRKSP